MSVKETALTNLQTALNTITGPDIGARNLTIPWDPMPVAGFLVLRDGEPGEPVEVTLSPTKYAYEHRAEVEVVVPGKTPALRDANLDTVLTKIDTAVAADRSLSNAVDYVRTMAPEELEELTEEGADDLKAVIVPIMLHYETNNPLS